MAFLLIAAMIAAMILLYGTDRLFKALHRGRRYRAMSERLDAAAERSEAQQEQRKTAAAQGAELTSVMPAINRPPLTLPGMSGPPRAPDTRPRPARRSGRAGHVTGPHQR